MKKGFFTTFFILLMILLAACGKNATNNIENANQNDDPTKETIEIKHELDDEPVIVPKKPEKVVVFDIGALDTIAFLGEQSRVVGFPKTTVPNYLKEFEAEQYENLGSLKEPEFEKIHASKPDLIIISGRQMDLYDQFKEIAPTIYIDIDTHNYLQSFENNARLIGEIFGKQEQIEAELAKLEEEIEAIKEEVEDSEETALIVLGTEGKISAYGPASRFGIIHDVFGVMPVDEHIEDSTHGQSITFEYILEMNPHIIYVIDRDSAIGMESSVKESFENDIVQKTDAFKNNRIVYLDGEIWYLAGGGLQSLHMMIEEIAKTFE